MEKIIYLVWKEDNSNRQDFADTTRKEVTPQLLATNPLGLQVNVVDDAISPAEHMLIENSKPRYYAMVSVWLHSNLDRQPIENILTTASEKIAGYLISESCPLVNTDHIAALGDRTPGLAHVVLLQKPERLSHEEWLDVWQNSHTQIAIDTQSTFSYRQNLVVRALTEGAPAIDAIVEESFPEAAMTSWEAFYDAVGDEEKFSANSQAMMDSVSRFIDFDKLNACSTSEYVYKKLL